MGKISSVLVVDNSGHIQKYFQPYLEYHFEEIHFVQADTKADTLPNGKSPDVMIINCDRPLKAYEHLIQSNSSHIPIITLFDPAHRHSTDEAAEFEQHPRLTGPVEPEDLVAILDELRTYRHNMELDIDMEEPAFESPYRKTIESALKESEANYQEIFNAASEGFFIYDTRKDRILDVNQAAESMFGYPKRELLELTIGQISSGIPPYTLREARIYMREALRNGQCLFEWHAKKKDGTLFWVEITLKRALLGGRERIIVATRDITERKTEQLRLEESEKKLRTIFEYAGEGILAADIKSRRFIFANRKMCEMLGYSEEELLGFTVEDIHPQEELPHIIKMFRGVAEGKYDGTYELQMQHKDGTRLYVEGSATFVDSVDSPHIIGVFKDITKTRRLLDELIETKTSLAKAKEIAKMGAFDHNLVTDIQTHSDTLLKILGLPKSKQNIPIAEFLAMLHPDDARKVRDTIHSFAKKHRDSGKTEVRYIRPDGKVLNLLIAVTIKFDQEGNPLIVRGLMQDITERREMEQELRESETKYRSIVEMTNTVPWRYDLVNDQYTYVGPQIHRLWGYPQSEWEGATIDTWYQRIHPDDRDRAKTFCLNETLQGRDHTLEFRAIHPDGKTIWIKESVSVVSDGNANPIELIGYMFDIHEQKEAELALQESEELFRTLSENILTGIILFTDDRIIYVNPAAQEILGYKEATLKKQFQEKRLTPGLQAILRDEKKILGGDENLTLFYKEIEIATKGGERHWIQIETNGVSYKGEPSRMAVFTDITQEKVNRDRLNETTKKLQHFNANLEKKVQEEVEKNRQKEQLMLQQSRFAQMGEMLSMIAHQWRQPLNAISTTAINMRLDNQLLGKCNRELDERAHFIEEQTEHMSETINDFMDLFRPVKNRSRVCLKDAIEAVNKIIGAQMQSRDIRIVVDIPEDLCIIGTLNELEHVLLNLITNARDAFEERETPDKRIMIQAVRKGGNVLLTVADNAGGIPDSLLGRLFEAYFTTKPSGKGTGIGLYMSKIIIERNFDGTITAANRDEGALFTITLKGDDA